MPRGLEAEGRGAFGQRQVVINRFGHMRHADGAMIARHPRPDPFGDLAGGKGRVVAADGHKSVDLHLGQNFENLGHVFFFFGRVGARSAEDGAAIEIGCCCFLYAEYVVVLETALDEVFEAVLEADDFHFVFFDGFDGDG